MSLRQDNMTVAQYAKFNELPWFAPHIIPDEPREMMMFQNGLKDDLRCRVVGYLSKTYKKVVDRD